MVFSSGGGVRSFVQVAAVCAFALSAIPTVRTLASNIDSGSGSIGKEQLESCGISDGDKAFGIQVVTDVNCATGGLGCYNDHCRYCKIVDTLKSSHLENCEAFGASFPSMAPLTVSTGACHVSSGDAAVGVGGMTDPSCLYGGIGCSNDHCRFCQIQATPQSSQFLPCTWASSSSGSVDGSAGNVDLVPTNGDAENAEPSVSSASASRQLEEAGTAGVCTMTASDGDVGVGISITTDTTCASGGVGCIDSICRYCRAKDTTQSAHLDACPAAIATTVCTTTVSTGDAAVGINIVTDASCTQGGLGCIDNICRFCRKTLTPQSSSFIDCASIGSSVSPTQAPAPTTPAPTTSAPVTSAPVTAAPVVTVTPTPASKQTCSQTVSDGDAAVGIKIVTDTSCSSGGLGCLDQVCRFCKVTTSVQSASFVDCTTIQGASTAPAPTTAALINTPAPTTAAPTTTPTTTSAPTTTSSTPSIVFTCSRTVSNGDKSVGLDIVSDIRCSDGGTGCLDEVCRFCKRFDTVQSQTYLDCSSIPSADIGSDIALVPIPVVHDSDAPTRMLAAVASACTMTVAAGDAAVGINIVTDTSCSTGGTGCIDNVCRYCKTKDTTQSAHLTSCPATTTSYSATSTAPSTATSKICTSTASDGDVSVGINIITDTSCVNGGLGCIDSVCRYCKTKSTDQSAHFGNCSDYLKSAFATTAPVTVAPISAPTSSPLSTTSTYSIPLDCYQIASSGDKNMGLDIVTDIRCGDGGVGCVDSTCRFCKRFDTAQSRSYMSCSDIPSSDNGADVNFKTIITDDTQTRESDAIVSLHEANRLASEPGDICANVSLADGQAAGGIGVVLDTVNCPEGLASGCIGDEGCRYCMRFPTEVSKYLDYCAIANGSDVAYTLSGNPPAIEDGSVNSTGEGSVGILAANADTVEKRALTEAPTPLSAGTSLLVAVAAVCAAVVAVVGFAAFGIKKTIGSLTRSSPRSSEKEKVSPDNENRPSVLIASNVGEPGVISDV